MEFENGVSNFTLKHNETKTVKNLPIGINYSITENPDPNYFSYAENSTGTITPNNTITSSFINTEIVRETNAQINQSGNLKVSKIVKSNNIDRNKEFEFTVILSDTSINGTFGDMTFENGVATFTLKHDDAKIANNLPAGINYTVKETPNDNYSTTSTNSTGTITPNNTITSSFINTEIIRETSKEMLNLGSLKVSKTVIAKNIDKDREFTFTVTLSDTSINGTFGDMDFENGIAKFNLKHNESKIADNLPAGINYTVIEDPYVEYITNFENNTGTINPDSVSISKFINSYIDTSISITPHTPNLDKPTTNVKETSTTIIVDKPTVTSTSTIVNKPTNTSTSIIVNKSTDTSTSIIADEPTDTSTSITVINTSDSNNILLWTITFISSFVGLIYLYFNKSKIINSKKN